MSEESVRAVMDEVHAITKRFADEQEKALAAAFKAASTEDLSRLLWPFFVGVNLPPTARALLDEMDQRLTVRTLTHAWCRKPVAGETCVKQEGHDGACDPRIP